MVSEPAPKLVDEMARGRAGLVIADLDRPLVGGRSVGFVAVATVAVSLPWILPGLGLHPTYESETDEIAQDQLW